MRRPRRWWGIILFVILWEAGVRLGWISPWAAVAPSQIPTVLLRMTLSGDLPKHLAATMLRLTTAFVGGSLAGLATGLAAGIIRPLREPVEPLVSILNAVPKLALLPLALAVLGAGEFSRSLPAFTTCFAMMALHGMDAVRAAQPGYIEVARSYGASGPALFRFVYLPSCLPQIFTGLRLAIGVTLVMVVSVEMLGAPAGLGSLIWLAGQSMAIERLYAGLIVCAGLGIALTLALQWIERRLLPWTVVWDSGRR